MSSERFDQARILAEEIIRDIEKDTIELDLVCLKASRLALLTNAPDQSEQFTDMAQEVGESKAHIDAVEERFELILQEEPPNSLLGNNFYFSGQSEVTRKKREIGKLRKAKKSLSTVKTKVYKFSLNVYYKLRFSDVPGRVFERTRLEVDRKLVDLLPEAKEKFFSVYSNLESENPEDWSNAVHSCRRILQALADELYPSQNGETVDRNGMEIKIGSENYINWLVLYVEERSDSERFEDIVGSHLRYLGERLDAVYDAANKGTHAVLNSVEEAERYVVFTYLLIGDILKL